MDQLEILEAEATILRHRLQIVLAQIRQLKRENRPKNKRLSAEARRKIGEAQKKKWADYRSKKKK
jgi:septum formation topological specificity factor MinE